jgi:hypothetical protein
MTPEYINDTFARFMHYLDQATNDPFRVAVLVAFNAIEEMIEIVIAEAVPNSECFDVSSMRFPDKKRILRRLHPELDDTEMWGVLDALNNLRAAAAHRNYEQLREKRFEELMAKLPPKVANISLSDRESLLQIVVAHCFGMLSGLRN